MKTLGKIMFVGLSLLVAMPAGAVVVSTGKTFKGRSPQFLNHKFCKDNQIRLVVEEEKKNGDYGHTTDRYVVYDEKLNEIGSFKVPDFPEVSSSYTRANVINGPFGIHESYVQDDIEAENMSQEVFIEMASSRGYIRQQVVDGELRVFGEDENQYYYYEFFKTEYPREYLYWKDNTVYRRHVEYDYDGWGSTGVYGDAHTYETKATPSPVYIYPKTPDCLDIDDIVLSQTLFNTDDLYEYVIPVFEGVSVSYQNEYEKVEGRQVRTTGLQVINENGSVVTDVRFPEGYYGQLQPECDLYIMGETYYLFVDAQTKNDNENVSLVFEVNPRSASINMVGAPIGMRVSPTTPQRGADVTVDLGAAAGENCRVNVVSVSGNTVISAVVEPGAESMSLSTSRLDRGMYIVTVSDGNSSREATKIIVR